MTARTYMMPPQSSHRRTKHTPAPGHIPLTKKEYVICPYCTVLFVRRLDNSHHKTCGAPACVSAQITQSKQNWQNNNRTKYRDLGIKLKISTYCAHGAHKSCKGRRMYNRRKYPCECPCHQKKEASE